MKRQLTCIGCPMGCGLNIEINANGDIKVEGNVCAKGVTYAKGELTNPVRNLSTVVKLKGGCHKMLPVKTNKPIAKGKLFDVMKEANKLEVCAPVNIGQVIAFNISDTGADLIATRQVDEKKIR